MRIVNHSLLIVTLGLTSPALASVVEITDKEKWESAVGLFTTIDFVLPPAGTPISDQYSHLGVTFSGIPFSFESGLFPNDNWGMEADGGAWVHFDSPQSWLAVEFPGRIKIDLYLDGKLFYASGFFVAAIHGRFAGVISDQPFDMAYLHRTGASNKHIGVDDLHFGTFIPAPGALGLLALGAMFGPRRQRRTC